MWRKVSYILKAASSIAFLRQGDHMGCADLVRNEAGVHGFLHEIFPFTAPINKKIDAMCGQPFLEIIGR